MRFSFFSSSFSNEPQTADMPWDNFINTMRTISEVKGHKPYKGEYTEQGMISSAIYAPNTKRGNKNVLGWDMVLLDIDSGIDLNSLDQLVLDLDYNFLIYSSPSCTKDHIKIRLCLELHEFAPKEVLSQLWFAVNAMLGNIVDKQTKDKSRMMYVPARYDNTEDYYHIFIECYKDKLNWEELINKYPSPKENEKYHLKNKLSLLKRKIYVKTNKLPCFNIQAKKCPFCYDNMIDEYRLTPAGEHHLALYRFMIKVCYNAKRINYPLSIDELVDMARQLDDLDGSFYNDKKFYDSAQDAIEYVGI